MNTKRYTLFSGVFLTVALIAGLLSCTRDKSLEQEIEHVGDYLVSIHLRGVTTAEPKTYGSVSAETFESNLTTTHALIFSEEGKYLGIRPVTVTDVQAAGDATHDTKAKATFDLGTSLGSDGKTVQFVLVGNLNTANFNTEIEALRVAKSKATINDLTLEDIKMLRITQAPDAKDHFVMLGEPQGGGVASVTVKRNIPQEYSGVIDMERLSARIDVKIGGGSNNAGLSVTGVKLMKKQGHSYLYEKGGNPSGESLTSGEEASAMYTEAPLEKKIYTYENSVAEATYVEVSLALNGVALKPVIVPFTGKAIERNHIYTVSLDRDPADNPNIDPNLNQPRITFKVDINDWNVDYRYIENYADDSAPVLIKVTKHLSTTAGFDNITINTVDAQNVSLDIGNVSSCYLLMDVDNKSTQSVGVVTEGNEWLELRDITTYGGGLKQQYRLEVRYSLDQNITSRRGKIEFRNKLHPEHKIIVTISQETRPNLDVPDKPSGLKLPLEYVADYNGTPDAFVTSYSVTANKPKFKAGYKLTSRDYHVPSAFEWNGIFPGMEDVFSGQGEVISERIKVGFEPLKTYVSQYQKGQDNLTLYALRYKGEGNRYLSAWKYSLEKNPWGGPNAPENDKLFIVRCIYLGPGYEGTLENIANEDFWEAHLDKAITRYFPAPGSSLWPGAKEPSEDLFSEGSLAMYLSSTLNESGCYVKMVLGGLSDITTYHSGVFDILFNDEKQLVYHGLYNLRLFHGPADTPPSLVLPTKPSGLKLPIEYVAENNVNSAKTGFAIEETGDKPGFFPFGEIMSGFKAPAFSGYHVPTKDEWLSILPEDIGQALSGEVSETVNVGSEGPKTYTSNYVKRFSGILTDEYYGIRYQGHGNKLRSAWSYAVYQKKSVDGSDRWFPNTLSLKVTCVYLGPDYNVTVQDLADGFFERVPESKKITRVFSMHKCKRKISDGEFDDMFWDSRPLYPSVTSSGTHSAFFFNTWGKGKKFTIESVMYGETTPLGLQEYYYPVRLFKDR